MKKKILFVAMFASISLASNAKEKVTTSCGETYVIEKGGDNVTQEQLQAYKDYMDWVYCG